MSFLLYVNNLVDQLKVLNLCNVLSTCKVDFHCNDKYVAVCLIY